MEWVGKRVVGGGGVEGTAFYRQIKNKVYERLGRKSRDRAAAPAMMMHHMPPGGGCWWWCCLAPMCTRLDFSELNSELKKKEKSKVER